MALALLALLVGVCAWVVYPRVRAVVIPTEITAAARGRALARELGCFTCHGPLGRDGVPNPGSAYDSVPSFDEGTLMMFAKSDEDLREYILDGAPASKRARASYRVEMESQAIRMPSYRDVVSDAQVDDLVAFLRASSELLFPPEGPASEGEELVREIGCFSCHGALGSGGYANPGSLKGYIPGFYGPDYAELVEDDAELRAWIEDGGIPRLNDDELAWYFISRQRVSMPGYADRLAAADVDGVMAYIKWLASEAWRDLEISKRALRRSPEPGRQNPILRMTGRGRLRITSMTQRQMPGV